MAPVLGPARPGPAGGRCRPCGRVPPAWSTGLARGRDGAADRTGRCGTRPPRWPRWARCWRPSGPEDAYLSLVVLLGGRRVDGHRRRAHARRWPPGRRSGRRLDGITEQMLWLDLVGYLPDDILTKLDRAAMATSLETRVPFLDRAVFDLAWRLPLSVKLHDGHHQVAPAPGALPPRAAGAGGAAEDGVRLPDRRHAARPAAAVGRGAARRAPPPAAGPARPRTDPAGLGPAPPADGATWATSCGPCWPCRRGWTAGCRARPVTGPVPRADAARREADDVTVQCGRRW